MAWHRIGDKPLSEPIMVNLLTHICVTRPQWVNPTHAEKDSRRLLRRVQMTSGTGPRWINTCGQNAVTENGKYRACRLPFMAMIYSSAEDILFLTTGVCVYTSPQYHGRNSVTAWSVVDVLQVTVVPVPRHRENSHLPSLQPKVPRWQGSWGHHGAHLGPVGPRWAPWTLLSGVVHNMVTICNFVTTLTHIIYVMSQQGFGTKRHHSKRT